MLKNIVGLASGDLFKVKQLIGERWCLMFYGITISKNIGIGFFVREPRLAERQRRREGK